MKKYFLYCFLCFLFGLANHTVLAQDDLPDRRFKGGVILGVNLSQIDGDLLAGYNKPGFNTGLAVSAILTKRWEIGIELLYSQKGASRTLTDQLASAFDKIRLNYVEAPVLVHFYDWKFRVSTGLSYARLLNFTIIDSLGEDVSDRQDFRSGNFTFIIGADYFIRDNWSIGARWSRESDIQNNSGANDFRGRSVSIRSNYLF
ncbi:MAG: outer membrane beta-barrel protein [Saprospiraceae bacterium]